MIRIRDLFNSASERPSLMERISTTHVLVFGYAVVLVGFAVLAFVVWKES